MQLLIALSGHHRWTVIVKSERTLSLVEVFRLTQFPPAPLFTLGFQQCCC
jgi:hypothetical protein